VHPWPIGSTPGYLVRAAPTPVAQGRGVGRLRCERESQARFGVHIELFVRRQVMIVPAGVGVAKPYRRRFGRVVPGGCTYPLRTLEPTGVVEVRTGQKLTLRDVFAVWGQALGTRRLAGFRSQSPLLAFVGGRRRVGDPGAIPLTRHAEIVLEIGGYVRPHPSYLFRKGL